MPGLQEKILRVMEQTDVEGREAKPVERQRQLVRQEFRMHAMPDSVPVFHQLGIGAPRSFLGFGQFEILPLDVADF